MKKVYIDNNTIISCGLCPYRTLNHNQDLYCIKTGSLWEPTKNLINLDCPFIKEKQKANFKFKVTIIIRGGNVLSVQKDAGVELNIIDLDNFPITKQKYKTGEEINEIDFEVFKKGIKP